MSSIIKTRKLTNLKKFILRALIIVFNKLRSFMKTEDRCVNKLHKNDDFSLKYFDVFLNF